MERNEDCGFVAFPLEKTKHKFFGYTSRPPCHQNKYLCFSSEGAGTRYLPLTSLDKNNRSSVVSYEGKKLYVVEDMMEFTVHFTIGDNVGVEHANFLGVDFPQVQNTSKTALCLFRTDTRETVTVSAKTYWVDGFNEGWKYLEETAVASDGSVLSIGGHDGSIYHEITVSYEGESGRRQREVVKLVRSREAFRTAGVSDYIFTADVVFKKYE